MIWRFSDLAIRRDDLAVARSEKEKLMPHRAEPKQSANE
jgi:hypothetical protein